MLAAYSHTVLFMQLARVQDQVTSLKASNENLQKQTEDLINKLKEVLNYTLYCTIFILKRKRSLINVFLSSEGKGATSQYGGKVSQ